MGSQTTSMRTTWHMIKSDSNFNPKIAAMYVIESSFIFNPQIEVPCIDCTRQSTPFAIAVLDLQLSLIQGK